MLRYLSSIVFTFLFWGCNNLDKSSNSSTNNKSQTVIAFATLGSFDYSDFENKKQIVPRKFRDTISHILTNFEISYLQRLLDGQLTKDSSKIQLEADCFYPRHNILFIDENGKLTDYVLVCFECSKIKSTKTHKASLSDFENFFNSIGLKTFNRPDYHYKFYDSLLKTRKHNR